MIIFSSFNYVVLLHSTLANVSTPQSWGWGTMAAAGQWGPPWLGCYCCSLAWKMCKCSNSYMEKGGQIEMSILTFLTPRSLARWIVILDGPLLDSTSDYSKCNILFLLCLYLSQGETPYPMILYHYRQKNSTNWGENTLIKHQKHHHHGGAVWHYSGMAVAN